MKKIVYILLLLIPFRIAAEFKKDQINLPKDHLLTIENETGHKLFIMEDKSFKKLDPKEAVILYWKQPLSMGKERIIRIYYGGNIRDNLPKTLNNEHKPGKRHGKTKKKKDAPAQIAAGRFSLIAQLRTNKPGTILLCYDENGILKMERI